MTTTIPRAEIDAVMARYNDAWSGYGDPDVVDVRAIAAELYKSDDQRAEADDLDALADYYDRGSV